MPTNRVAATAAAVALPSGTETAIATVTPPAPSNQVNAQAGAPNVLVRAEVVVTGAVSATTCTLRLRRGAGVAGTDILPTDVVASVDAAATDRTVVVTAQETPANFNAANGIYTVTGQAAGAAQTARIAQIETQPLSVGV